MLPKSAKPIRKVIVTLLAGCCSLGITPIAKMITDQSYQWKYDNPIRYECRD